MQYYVPALAQLIEQFQKLPTIGNKNAQRLAFHLLSIPKEEALAFADAIIKARESMRYCAVCQNLTDSEVCPYCSDDNRDHTVICVVEDPRDIVSIEKTREYHGVYHVLHGAISPIDSIGPEDIKIMELLKRCQEGQVQEIIMATNPTIEGEATSMYLSRLLKPLGIRVTRLAYGIPVGGNLEYADEVTLLRAMEGRKEM